MKPTRLSVLLLVALVLGAVGYVLADTAYADIPPLPPLAPVSLLLLTLVELALAYVVRSKVRGRRPAGRSLHPLQIARAAVLAKASTMAGAVLTGLYGGIFLWTFARRAELASSGDDARVSGLSMAAALALVVAALLLERSCRTPDLPDENSSTRGAGGPRA